jgi:hypothetical protein
MYTTLKLSNVLGVIGIIMGFKYQFIAVLCFALCVGTSASATIFDAKKAYRAWVMISKIEHREGLPLGLLHSMSLVETGSGMSGSMLPWPYTLGVNSPGYKQFNNNEKLKSHLEHHQKLGFKKFDLEINNEKHRNIGYTEILKLAKFSGSQSKINLKPLHFSRQFASKEKAKVFATELLDNDYDNFDIGMMQINWHYHKGGFESIDDALDVYRNTNYAVSYLRKHRKNRTWWETVGRYHSGTEKYAKKYIRNVWNMYKRIHNLDV